MGSTENMVFSNHRKCPIHRLLSPHPAGKTCPGQVCVSTDTAPTGMSLTAHQCHLHSCSAGPVLPSACCVQQSEISKKPQIREHFDGCCDVQGDTSIFPHVWVKGENSTQKLLTPARFLLTQLSKADSLPPPFNALTLL